MGFFGYLWDFMDIGKPKYFTGSWEFVGMNHQFNSDLRIKTWWCNGDIMV